MNKKYRSPLEKRLAKKLKGWKYEPFKVAYTTDHTYTPDFVKGEVWIEAKGFFRPGDQKKYIAIQEQHPEIELIFLFSNPNKPVRRGAKLTMGKWAERKGFTYYTEDTIDALLY